MNNNLGNHLHTLENRFSYRTYYTVHMNMYRLLIKVLVESFHFGSQTMRLTEESNMHKSLNNKTKQDFDKSVESFKKTIGTSLDYLYRNNVLDIANRF